MSEKNGASKPPGSVLVYRLTPRFKTRVVNFHWLPWVASLLFFSFLYWFVPSFFSAAWPLKLVALIVMIVIGLHLVSSPRVELAEVPYPPLANDFRDWRDLVMRLQRSTTRVKTRTGVVVEGDHLFLGTVEGQGHPVLLHKRILIGGHLHLLGSTGGRKTHGFLGPQLTQLAMRREVHIVVVDLKGDSALLYGLAIEAARAGMDFKWFTPELGNSSYIYNPLSQRYLAQQSLNERVQGLLQPLGVEQGEGYGAGFFGAVQEQFITRIVERHPVRSFHHLVHLIRDPSVLRGLRMNARDLKDTTHVAAIIERLARIPSLNGVECSERAMKGAIDVSDCISKVGITYFFLPALLEPTSMRIVGRFIPRQITAAARKHTGERVPVVVVLDEAQEIMQRDLGVLVKQARSAKVSLWFSHQNMSDLSAGATDFTSIIQGNTGAKLIFSARDAEGRQFLSLSSGEERKRLTSGSESQTTGTSSNDAGVTTSSSSASTSSAYHEYITQRLTQEKINAVNHDEALCILDVSPGYALTDFGHPIVVRTGFHISEAEFKRREALPWPKPNEFTIVATRDLPLSFPGDEDEPAEGVSRDAKKPPVEAPPQPVKEETAAKSPAAATSPKPTKSAKVKRERDTDMDSYLRSLLDS